MKSLIVPPVLLKNSKLHKKGNDQNIGEILPHIGYKQSAIAVLALQELVVIFLHKLDNR